MPSEQKSVLIVFDDREYTNNEIRTFVGSRRYGEIIYQRRALRHYLREHLPHWTRETFHHIRDGEDLVTLRKDIEASKDDMALFIISSRAGITDYERLAQLLKRLPYAEEDFVDRRYNPLLAFYADGHSFLDHWKQFTHAPIHQWSDPLKGVERVTSVQPLDLSSVKDFLLYMCGATETRHFNTVHIDNYFYTKCSTDKTKMLAEYRFYNLVPEVMRCWLVEPFEFIDSGNSASYKMMRYYLADAALQWVHCAFTTASFESFVDRLLFFVNQRPQKPVDRSIRKAVVQELFIDKVDRRMAQLLETQEGQRLNDMLTVTDARLDIRKQVSRYKELMSKYEKHFTVDHLVAGHGDPCFSNILYDQERYLLKLIDPKGAVDEASIWTHPLYDLCKISHSVLGDYDFINNGLYDLRLDNCRLSIRLYQYHHDAFKSIFLQKLIENGYDWKVVRLAEASLFLSMLPLHLDHPNKVTAFLLISDKILNEVEHG